MVFHYHFIGGYVLLVWDNFEIKQFLSSAALRHHRTGYTFSFVHRAANWSLIIINFDFNMHSNLERLLLRRSSAPIVCTLRNSILRCSLLSCRPLVLWLSRARFWLPSRFCDSRGAGPLRIHSVSKQKSKTGHRKDHRHLHNQPLRVLHVSNSNSFKISKMPHAANRCVSFQNSEEVIGAPIAREYNFGFWLLLIRNSQCIFTERYVLPDPDSAWADMNKM